MVSNLRKRKNETDKNKDNSSTLKKVQFAIEEVVFRRSNRKTTIERIESGTVAPYLILFVIVLGVSYYFVAFLHDINDDIIASHHDQYTRLFLDVPCSNDYGSKFKHCSPKKCGRVIKDNLFTKGELQSLKTVVEKGMRHGGGSGGATIMDLHSGALSYKDKFVNIFKAAPDAFTENDFQVYSNVKNKILHVVAQEFNVDKRHLYLTKPTFFSRIDNKTAVTAHDEYWHPHIDRVTYGTFYYTSLLYLSEFEQDFTGGRFMFIDKHVNRSVEPRYGRLSFFTSGSENKHFVEKVESGTRYAMTVSFTCDKQHGISDPSKH